MKKSKLSLCLASSFVAALSLAACGNSVSSKDNAVVSIKNYNGETVDILTDAAYRKYKTETDGVSKFYNAILEALIRYEYANPASAIRTQNWAKAIKGNSEIIDEANNNVKNDKSTAEENAKTNGTSYETEWENILSSHNCEDEADLLEYYIYQLEKEDITDKYFLEQKDSTLLTEWLGIKKDGTDPQGKAKGVFPYHIRHILAPISGGANDFYSGTITSAEAKEISNVVKDLLKINKDEGETFASVARRHRGDAGSADKGGDLGIMATTTSFVNEFKLGIYAYDAIYNDANQTKAGKDVIKAGLGIDNDYKIKMSKTDDLGIEKAWTDTTNGVNKGKIQEVPYEAFLKIGEMAEDEKDKNNKQVNKGNEHYFPRNVLYNYYLNFHNPFVIVNKTLDSYGLPDTASSEFAGRFQTVSIRDESKDVLVDENNNVIIGVRSEHGIHFMIMEKSIFEYDDPNVSLNEYFTSYTPSDTGYPTGKDTYVSYIETSESSTYISRANEIKTAVKSFDSTYDYRLFEYILKIEEGNVSIKDTDLKSSIQEYISRTQDTNSDNAYKTLNEAWRTYTELVALQYNNRNDWTDYTTDTYDKPFRTIHPRCAIGFKDHTGSAWTNAEGVCYYEE